MEIEKQISVPVSGLRRRVPAEIWAGVPAAGRGHRMDSSRWGKAWCPPVATDLFAQCWGREADVEGAEE